MQFEFHLPTRVVWRSPAINVLAEETQRFNHGVLLLSDPGLESTGLVEDVEKELASAGVQVTVLAEVARNPTHIDVAAARRAAVQGDCQAIVALGGGSVIDTAKAAAMLLTNGGEYREYQWEGRAITKRSLPLIAAPTTAGTGSEVTKVAVISDPDQPLKKGVLSPLMYPHVAVLDPHLTVGLPAHLTAGTGMDALSHALEAYVGKRTNPVSDLLALEALGLIIEFLPRATARGDDLDSRSQMLKAALYAGIAMDQAGLGLVHALSGGLCAHLGLHHGMTNAAILPAVMEFNLQAIEPGRTQRLAELLGSSPSELPGALSDLVETVGLPVGLSEDTHHLTGANWEAIASDSMRMAMLRNNPRPTSSEDMGALLQQLRR